VKTSTKAIDMPVPHPVFDPQISGHRKLATVLLARKFEIPETGKLCGDDWMVWITYLGTKPKKKYWIDTSEYTDKIIPLSDWYANRSATGNVCGWKIIGCIPSQQSLYDWLLSFYYDTYVAGKLFSEKFGHAAFVNCQLLTTKTGVKNIIRTVYTAAIGAYALTEEGKEVTILVEDKVQSLASMYLALWKLCMKVCHV
jgi:hypothetical protein